MRRLVVSQRPRVPDHQLLVVGDRPKEGLVQEVPGNILDDSGMPSEYRLGINALKEPEELKIRAWFVCHMKAIIAQTIRDQIR